MRNGCLVFNFRWRTCRAILGRDMMRGCAVPVSRVLPQADPSLQICARRQQCKVVSHRQLPQACNGTRPAGRSHVDTPAGDRFVFPPSPPRVSHVVMGMHRCAIAQRNFCWNVVIFGDDLGCQIDGKASASCRFSCVVVFVV